MPHPNNFVRHSLLVCLTSLALAAVAQTPVPATTPKPAVVPSVAPSAKDEAAMEVAFSRAGTNGNGKLSKEEAARMPAISATFEEINGNKYVGLSMEEFAVGCKTAAN